MSSPSNRDSLLSIVESKANLSGRFTNIVRLGADGGQGYFSLMFKATDLTTGKTVALKFFRPDARSDAYRWNCFQREADILNKLRGQRDLVQLVSPLEEFDEPASTATGFSFTIPFAFYGLELASCDVSDRLASASVNMLERLEIFHAMCRSVQRLHSIGISHRDLKPSNFLCMSDGAVKLSDFGTARDLSTSGPGLVPIYTGPVGDQRYVAPELLIALHDQYPQLSYGADLFALGATLFELLTGTILGPLVYNASVRHALSGCQLHANGHLRRKEYERIIGEVANRNPMPRVSSTTKAVPPSILPMVQNLYESMCVFDYRRRLTSFSQVFLRVQQCIFVLRHERQYSAWRLQKRRIRDLRAAKLSAAQVKP